MGRRKKLLGIEEPEPKIRLGKSNTSINSATLNSGAVDTTGASIIFCVLYYSFSANIVSITDTSGNTYELVAQKQTSQGFAYVWACQSPITNVANEITVQLSASKHSTICQVAYSNTKLSNAISSIVYGDGYPPDTITMPQTVVSRDCILSLWGARSAVWGVGGDGQVAIVKNTNTGSMWLTEELNCIAGSNNQSAEATGGSYFIGISLIFK